MEDVMKLYGFPPSPNTWKVRAVAVQLGTKLELQIVDLSKGEQRTPGYLTLNPTGRTPTLVDGDFKLWESTAIMQYLASRSTNSLWPQDARVRADITRWQSWQLQHFGPDACQPLTFQHLVKKILGLGPADPVIVDKALEAFKRDASVLDMHLTKQRYLVGQELTLADFSVAAMLVYAEKAEMPLGQYPRVQEWSGRIFALQAWLEAAPTPAAAAA
jgi:glutathione S-transferase